MKKSVIFWALILALLLVLPATVNASSANKTYTLDAGESVTFSNDSPKGGGSYSVSIGGLYDYVIYHSDGSVYPDETKMDHTGDLTVFPQQRVVVTNISQQSYDLVGPSGQFNPTRSDETAFAFVALKPDQSVTITNPTNNGDSFEVIINGKYDYVVYDNEGNVINSRSAATGNLTVYANKRVVVTNVDSKEIKLYAPYEKLMSSSQNTPSSPGSPSLTRYQLEAGKSVTFTDSSQNPLDVEISGTYDYVVYDKNNVELRGERNKKGLLEIFNQQRVVLTNVGAGTLELSGAAELFSPKASALAAFTVVTVEPDKTIGFANKATNPDDTFNVVAGGAYDYAVYGPDCVWKQGDINLTRTLDCSYQTAVFMTNVTHQNYEIYGPAEKFFPKSISIPVYEKATLQPDKSLSITVGDSDLTLHVGGTYDYVVYSGSKVVKGQIGARYDPVLPKNTRVVLTNTGNNPYLVWAPFDQFQPGSSENPAYKYIKLSPGSGVAFSNISTEAEDSFVVESSGKYDYVIGDSSGSVISSKQQASGELKLDPGEVAVVANSGSTSLVLAGPWEKFKPEYVDLNTQNMNPNNTNTNTNNNTNSNTNNNNYKNNNTDNGNSTGPGQVPNRLAGNDRFKTSKAIAQTVQPGMTQYIVLAAGNNFPDALSGSVLAHLLKAPIMLVDSTVDASQEAFDYVKNHLNAGGTAYLIGGSSVIGPEFTKALTQMGYKVKQIGGADRYATAILIAQEEAIPAGTPVVVASGENFPDALAISSFAAYKGWPILLVEPDNVPEIVSSFIQKDHPSNIYIVGGTGVVAKNVESSLRSLAGSATVTRLSGQDRFETAVNIAKTFGVNPAHIYFASGNNFPDALAGSVLAALNGSPVLLVDSQGSDLPVAVLVYMKQLSSKPEVTFFGANGAVSEALEQQIDKTVSGDNSAAGKDNSSASKDNSAANTNNRSVSGKSAYWVENGVNFVVDGEVKFKDESGIQSPRVSPDGRYVAYSQGGIDVVNKKHLGGGDLLVADLSNGAIKTVYKDKDDSRSVYAQGWSPDGSKILFTSQYSSLAISKNLLLAVSRDGGDPQSIFQGFESAYWGPDGNIVVAVGAGVINIIDLDGKTVAALKTPDGYSPSYKAENPTFSPDGKKVIYDCGGVYYLHDIASDSYRKLFEIPLGGKAFMAGNGKIIYGSSGKVWVYDPVTGKSEIYYDKAKCSDPGWMPN